MATIKDVAKKANVSVATVSRVLNGSNKVSESTRKAVLKAQKELVFSLNANARALAQHDSSTIGVVVSDLSDPYFGVMVKSCEDIARKAGYSLIVSQGFHDEKREIAAIENLISYRCRGYVIHALKITNDKLAQYMDRLRSMVLINRILNGYENRCINIDNVKGSYIAATEVIKNGHKLIAYVGSSHKILDTKERELGFIKALEDHNIKFNRELVVRAEPYLQGGTQAANKLIDLYKKGLKFTAILCYNDYMAAGIMSKLIENNLKVPDDVSVVGFDNLYLAQCLNPTLTTVQQPIDKMSNEATRLSLALYYNEEYQLPKFDVKLVKRKSLRNIILNEN